MSRVLQDGIWTKVKEAFLVHKKRHRANKVHMFSKSKHLPKTGLPGRRRRKKKKRKELIAILHHNCNKLKTM